MNKKITGKGFTLTFTLLAMALMFSAFGLFTRSTFADEGQMICVPPPIAHNMGVTVLAPTNPALLTLNVWLPKSAKKRPNLNNICCPNASCLKVTRFHAGLNLQAVLKQT